jgi:hypothetical protein
VTSSRSRSIPNAPSDIDDDAKIEWVAANAGEVFTEQDRGVPDRSSAD